jgi:hypothetical protein
MVFEMSVLGQAEPIGIVVDGPAEERGSRRAFRAERFRKSEVMAYSEDAWGPQELA